MTGHGLTRGLSSFCLRLITSLCVVAKPDVTLTITDSDLVDMMSGRLNSQKAFFQGKLKV